MIGQIRRVSVPAILLWAFALAYGLAAGLTLSGALPKRAELAADICLPFLLAFWVVTDVRKREQRICYDFDSFVFFAWPFVLPVYLFKTRGWRALWVVLWLISLFALSALVSLAVSAVRPQ